MERRLLDFEQTKKYLGVSKPTLTKLLKTKELLGFKVGREWRISTVDIYDYEERQKLKVQAV